MEKNKVVKSILTAEAVLLLPFTAMFFTGEVDWNFADFVIAGILLAGAGFAYLLAADGIKNNPRQAAIGLALGAAMFLLWAELAVDIFGSPIAGS
jgi:hypothetical protein